MFELTQRGIMEGITTILHEVTFVINLTSPSMDSHWLKDGVKITSNEKYQISCDDTGIVHTLVVSYVNKNDEGIYSFRVSAARRKSTVITFQGLY